MSSQNQPLVVVSSLPSISNSNQFETVQPESRGKPASEEDLMSLIAQIELRDGKLDGKVATVPQTCNMCRRVVSNRTSICLYCSTHNVNTTVF
jgi:hypothetical protein